MLHTLPATTPRKRLLIVSADPDLREMLTDFLEIPDAYELRTASSLVRALAYAQLVPPDLLVYNPGPHPRRSAALIEELRGHPAFANLPILVVGAVDPWSSLGRPPAVCVPHPFGARVLLLLVDDLLSRCDDLLLFSGTRDEGLAAY